MGRRARGTAVEGSFPEEMIFKLGLEGEKRRVYSLYHMEYMGGMGRVEKVGNDK